MMVSVALIFILPTSTGLFRWLDWLPLATRCLGRRNKAEVAPEEQCSPSLPTASILRTCTVFSALITEYLRRTDLSLPPGCFSPATPCTERRRKAAFSTRGLCLPSKPTARDSRTCTIFPG